VRILVTAGPTREYFDDVRFISNASSGMMGYAIAKAAADRGHRVVLVSGPVALRCPDGVDFIAVTTGREMLEACTECFTTCDAAVMCAAVCDYRPATRQRGKSPKTNAAHSVILEPTEDICAALGRMKEHRVLLGFALQTDNARAQAEAKLRQKHCDAIVLNHPAGVGKETTTLRAFVPEEGWSPPRSAAKSELAAYLLDLVERLVRPE
jgi:phosphopantothenoylcysteine decarboxylase/phosphopantothenate--cysteine ligase